MNEDAIKKTLTGRVCEVEPDKDGSIWTTIYLGRKVDPLTLKRNGLPLGSEVLVTGLLKAGEWKSFKGSLRIIYYMQWQFAEVELKPAAPDL